MITIQIPEWLQWAAVGLAVAYAIPRALRVVVVAIFWLSKLLVGRCPIEVDQFKAPPILAPVPLIAYRKRIWRSLRYWTLDIGVQQAEPRGVLRERAAEEAALEAKRREEKKTRGT